MTPLTSPTVALHRARHGTHAPVDLCMKCPRLSPTAAPFGPSASQPQMRSLWMSTVTTLPSAISHDSTRASVLRKPSLRWQPRTSISPLLLVAPTTCRARRRLWTIVIEFYLRLRLSLRLSVLISWSGMYEAFQIKVPNKTLSYLNIRMKSKHKVKVDKDQTALQYNNLLVLK